MLKETEGIVTKIIFRNKKNFYTIALIRVKGVTETILGYFPIINEGLKIRFHGKKIEGRRRDEQYRSESYTLEFPNNDYHLFLFLSNDFFGVDTTTASMIADKCGIAYLNNYSNKEFIIENVGENFYKENLTSFWELSRKLEQLHNKFEILETMQLMGFTPELSAKVAFSEFKTTAKSLRENPYQIIFPFDLTWDDADKVALRNGIKQDSTLRIEEGICYILDEAVQKSAHIYLPRDELYIKAINLLKVNLEFNTYKSLETQLENKKRVYCDVDYNIYGYRYFRAEQQLSKDLYRIHSSDEESAEDVQLAIDFLEKDKFPYSPEQREAILAAFKYPLVIINGSAGTGKTTILRKFIEIYLKIKNKNKKDEFSLQMCAPTGKAADRMTEVTGFEAKTGHLLLGHDPLTKLPIYNSQFPFPYDCLIIDEASMIDTILFSELLNAAKKGCKVIIVGDVDQLPSIGPGNVLFELIHNSPFHSIKLNQVHRQGEESLILKLATLTRTGNKDIYSIVNKPTDELSFIKNSNIESIAQQIIQTAKLLKEKSNIDFWKDVQILTPIHKGELGTQRLNQRIQEMLNEHRERKKIVFGDKSFYVDDKVMHTKNNRDKKISNGETGRIRSIVNKTVHVQYFNGKEITYTGEELFELEVAFVTTVHKMQGSESKFIILPVHVSFNSMLQRKLFYTAQTRAKSKLLIIGQPIALIKAIGNDSSEKRNCNLKQRLIEASWTNFFDT